MSSLTSADLLSNFERCQRWGYWSRSWRKHRIHPMEMFQQAVRYALPLIDTSDPGEEAGSHIMQLATDAGIDYDRDNTNLYRCALSHASAADLVTTAIRQSSERPWSIPASIPGWTTSAMMSPEGDKLRRFIGVSSWSEDREEYEKYSWYTLGETAHFGLPLDLVVADLGPMRGGRRHAYWNRALWLPYGNQLRFKLRRKGNLDDFSDKWRPVYREEHDEIPRERWLEKMHDDEVLSSSLFVVHFQPPDEDHSKRIREMAARQLDRLMSIFERPEKQMATCRNPLSPCPFVDCCWDYSEREPSEEGGFDRVTPS